MADPFLGEIRLLGGNFAPRGWALCNGQLLPISQNTALFALLGTYYGGNGVSTFALPDLQGSAPVHAGQGPGLSARYLGESGGAASVTLLASEIPAHSHPLLGTATPGEVSTPGATTALARSTGKAAYHAPDANLVSLHPQMLSATGGDLPHNNLMPYLVLTFCIALQGVFPPRT